MAMDFPASPTEGQTYQAPGGPLYTYRAPAWRSGVTVPQIAKAQRNRLVNGAMQISQELTKTSTYTAANSYIADQWIVNFTTAGAPAFGLSTDTGGDVVNFILLNNTVADASVGATDYYRVGQIVEGTRIADFRWGKTGAKPVVLRFKASSSITGTFAVCIQSGGYTFVKNLTFATASTWTDFTVPIPALTAGTTPIDTSSGLSLFFNIMAGSSFHAPVDGAWNSGGWMTAAGVSNWMSATGQTFLLANVGLYLDADNTGVPPRWEMPDEADELIACQRYWQRFTDTVYGSAAYTTNTGHYGDQTYIVPMRIAPAVSLGTPTYANASALAAGQRINHCYYSMSSVAAGNFNVVFTPTYSARM